MIDFNIYDFDIDCLYCKHIFKKYLHYVNACSSTSEVLSLTHVCILKLCKRQKRLKIIKYKNNKFYRDYKI